MLDEVLANASGLDGGWGRLRGGGGRFSLEGSSYRSLDVSFVTSSCVWSGGLRVKGNFAVSPLMPLSAVDLIEAGVPALEDGSLVGEIDLARSKRCQPNAPQPIRYTHSLKKC